jgi:outer membrane protein OmpA-like peptidoglycan-associated protein
VTTRPLTVTLLAAVLLLAGCSDDADPGPSAAPSATTSGAADEPSELEVAQDQPVLARLEGTESGKGLTLDLLGVERSSASHVTARFLVTTEEEDVQGKDVNIGSLRSGGVGTDGYRGDGFSNLRLVDETAGEVLWPLRNAEKRCLCTELEFTPDAGPDGQQVAFVTFPAVAAETETVALQVRDFPMSPLIELEEPGEVAFEGEPSASATEAAEAIRLGLLAPSAALDGASRTVEQGDQVDVAVSSDVLFAFGSAELSPAAQSTLSRVAEELKARAVGPVEVVGHTDTVGDEAANQALSEARARAVQGALQPLVPDLALSAAGRGETEPVADDRGRGDSPEAALNRRVTIRYTVAPPPPPPAPSPEPSPSAGPADGPVLASISGDGRTFEVLDLERLSSGMVQGTFRLTSTASAPANYQQDLNEDATVSPYEGATLSGLRLVDAASQTAYAPLTDTRSQCLCTPLLARNMQPQETTLLYATFTAPPESSTTVDITVPSFDDPLTGVRIR